MCKMAVYLEIKQVLTSSLGTCSPLEINICLYPKGYLSVSGKTVYGQLWSVLSTIDSLDISQSDITWYWTKYERNEVNTLFRLWTQKYIPYLALTGKLWDIFSEFFGEKLPLDIESAMYPIRLLRWHRDNYIVFPIADQATLKDRGKYITESTTVLWNIIY